MITPGVISKAALTNGSVVPMTSYRATLPAVRRPVRPEDLEVARAGPAFGEPQERVFSSRDVEQAAGLSLCQQNRWDARGVLPHARSGEAGWRRFCLREIFALAICVEIRRRFKVPLECLKWVQDHMLCEGADHLKAAVDQMATVGVGVWLLTDLEDTFVMDCEAKFQDLWRLGVLGAHNESGFVLLNLSPLVNRVLSCLKDPVALRAHGYDDETVAKIRSLVASESPARTEALQTIQNQDLARVEVTAPNGPVETIGTTSRSDTSTWLEELVANRDHSTLTVINKNGEVARITQESGLTVSSEPST
jgi:hypothetical protein